MQTSKTRLTPVQIAFLATRRRGRLATADHLGNPHISLVTFVYNPEVRAIEIRGHNLSKSRKFQDIQENQRVSLLVDDMHGQHPSRVRGIEIRGMAEAFVQKTSEEPDPADEIIRIRPRKVVTFGMDEVPAAATAP